MKSLFLIIVLILVQGFNASLYSCGLVNPTGGDRGLLLGFGLSNFVGSASSYENNKFIPGITLGFYQDFRIKPRFTLETGLLLSTKGSRLDAVGDLYLHQIITYLEFSVLASWTASRFEKVNIFLAGGPFLGVKLLAFNEVGFPEEIHGFDVGLELGAGVKLKKGSLRMELKQGLLNIDKSETHVDYKNLTASLVARISF